MLRTASVPCPTSPRHCKYRGKLKVWQSEAITTLGDVILENFIRLEMKFRTSFGPTRTMSPEVLVTFNLRRISKPQRVLTKFFVQPDENIDHRFLFDYLDIGLPPCSSLRSYGPWGSSEGMKKDVVNRSNNVETDPRQEQCPKSESDLDRHRQVPPVR